jgi:hypothetical protein
VLLGNVNITLSLLTQTPCCHLQCPIFFSITFISYRLHTLPIKCKRMQVSEHASWSAGYYGRMINAVLAAGGAPPDLVQFVTGYAEAGNALVTGGAPVAPDYDGLGWPMCALLLIM